MWARLHLDFPEVFEEPARQRSERAPDRYGRWGGLVRALAGHDHEKATRVLRWPLRETLHAYRNLMREHALADYRHRVTVWAITAPYIKSADRRPPALPRILRDILE